MCVTEQAPKKMEEKYMAKCNISLGILSLRIHTECERKVFAQAAKKLLLMDSNYALNLIPVQVVIYVAKEVGGLDWLIEKGFVERVKEPEVTYYNIGDCFMLESMRLTYILIQYNERQVNLVNLDTGCAFRWADGIRNLVKNVHAITQDEFDKIRNYDGEFILCANPFRSKK